MINLTINGTTPVPVRRLVKGDVIGFAGETETYVVMKFITDQMIFQQIKTDLTKGDTLIKPLDEELVVNYYGTIGSLKAYLDSYYEK